MLLFRSCIGNDTEESRWPINALFDPVETKLQQGQEPAIVASEVPKLMKKDASMKLLTKSQSRSSLPGLRESFYTDDDETDESSDVTSIVTATTPQDADKEAEEMAAEMDLKTAKYLNKRGNMTPLQERINGLTTLPAGIYCILFCLTGSWLSQTLIQQVQEERAIGSDFQGDGCISISWLSNLHAMPPMPVIAGAMSMILHMPFSFIYHFIYAHQMSQPLLHWSRRMDQTMLHVYSSLLSYAFSGRTDYFVANLIMNADSIVKLWEKGINPRRNQTRLIVSILCFTLPILESGDFSYFGRLWGTMAFAFAIFGLYPFGGWSHTVFHLIFLNVPPMMMTYIPTLPASQEQLQFAAQCAVWAKSQ